MGTTRQAISRELNKLNDYEQKAVCELLRYYTTTHRAKYACPQDFEQALEPLRQEAVKAKDSLPKQGYSPKEFIPVIAAHIGLMAFTNQDEQEHEAES